MASTEDPAGQKAVEPGAPADQDVQITLLELRDDLCTRTPFASSWVRATPSWPAASPSSSTGVPGPTPTSGPSPEPRSGGSCVGWGRSRC